VYLILYPMIGAGLGCLIRRSPAATRWVRPATFFAVEPLSAQESEERGRRVRRSASMGFGTGLVLALVATALDFAWRGWPFLAPTLIIALLLYPYVGVLIGFNLGLRQGDPKPSIRHLRFRMRTLMILVAYVALLLGLGSEAARVSGAARQCHAKALTAQAMIDVFRGLLEKSLVDLARRKNAEELRQGRIPAGLLPSQKDFLKSLDTTANEEYKKYRYALIADGEEQQAKLAEVNVGTYDRLINYHRKLAEKYEKAAQEPWVPVGPDPPMPP
jgi:hypothetical protein